MGDPAKVLLVDDDPDAVEAARLVLEAKGYQVVAAASAKEALEKTSAERPDVILLDVMMPEGTEGFHFVWTLRRHEDAGLRETPIIVVSGIHDRTQLRFYPEEGDGTYEPGGYLPVQDFVDKPIDAADLVQRIERVLASGGRRDT